MRLFIERLLEFRHARPALSPPPIPVPPADADDNAAMSKKETQGSDKLRAAIETVLKRLRGKIDLMIVDAGHADSMKLLSGLSGITGEMSQLAMHFAKLNRREKNRKRPRNDT